jgi:hypothetical protein
VIKYNLLIVILCLINLTGYAQAEHNFDAYSMSVSGVTITSAGIYSLNENQGGLAYNRECALAVNYSNRYLLSDISDHSLGLIFPTGKSTAGISIFYYGNTELNQSRYSLALGRKLGSWLSAGILMNYNHLAVRAIGERASTISGNMGIQAYPIKNLCFGMEILNPTKSRFDPHNEDDLYSGFKTGISFTDPEIFWLAVQYNMNNFATSEWCLAGEYLLLKSLTIRGGLKIKENPSWSFGTSIKYKRFHFDFGFENHTVLGLSVAVSLIYSIKPYED